VRVLRRHNRQESRKLFCRSQEQNAPTGDPDITYKHNKDTGFSNALLWHFAPKRVFWLPRELSLLRYA